MKLENSSFKNVAILDYFEEFSAESAPCMSVNARSVNITNLSTENTIGLYSTSGVYVNSKTVNV